MISAEELKNLKVDKVVDARGTSCPGPLLEAKKAIGTINSGQIMEVLSSDEGTKRDLPMWCDKKGHALLGIIDEPGYFRVVLKKA